MAYGGKVVTSAQRGNSAVIGDGRDLGLGYYANGQGSRFYESLLKGAWGMRSNHMSAKSACMAQPLQLNARLIRPVSRCDAKALLGSQPFKFDRQPLGAKGRDGTDRARSLGLRLP